MKISARNVLEGRVKEIKTGPVNSQVVVDIGGHAITSMITTDAVNDLALKEGKAVRVIIKASEVLLGVD
jgi:molybdopterin-binding protein